MPQFRVYLMNHADHIMAARDVEADDEPAAIAAARVILAAESERSARVRGVELWQGSRMLCALAAEQYASQPPNTIPIRSALT